MGWWPLTWRRLTTSQVMLSLHFLSSHQTEEMTALLNKSWSKRSELTVSGWVPLPVETFTIKVQESRSYILFVGVKVTELLEQETNLDKNVRIFEWNPGGSVWSSVSSAGPTGFLPATSASGGGWRTSTDLRVRTLKTAESSSSSETGSSCDGHLEGTNELQEEAGQSCNTFE